MPKGAKYIYNLNFFAGFVVASATYWVLCKLSPIPAVSAMWMEVGDEIENPSLADGARFVEERDSGSGEDGWARGGKEDKELGVNERPVAGAGENFGRCLLGG